MRINELITLYGRMRFALIIAVPVAMWGFVLWLSGGQMLPACLFGIAVMFPVIDILPEPKEVRRILKTRESNSHIWYMVEDYDGTVRTYK